MKISETRQSTIGQELPKAKSVEDPPVKFNRFFAEEAEKITGTAGEPVSGGELGALSAVFPFELTPMSDDFSNECQQAELAVEGTINHVEKLQLALQNPMGGLKEVAAALQDLSAGTTELQQMVASLPEDHQLRQIADEMAVLAHVETVKFQRGDYL